MILEFFQVDRCGLIRILPGKGVWIITHFALLENVAAVPAGVRLPVSIHPWAYERLVTKRQGIVCTRIDDMPPEADVDKHTMSSGKSERTCPGDLIPRLQLLGEIFVNCLEPRRMQLQLTQALRSRNGGDCRGAWEGI